MIEVYEGKEPYVFISYAHLDNSKVNKYLSKLQRRGCNIWFDAGIEVGSNWNEFIARHLIKAECVILFLTNNSVNSEYVLDEINLATSRKIKIIPIYIEQVHLPLGLELLLGRIQAIDLSNNENFDCKKIVNSLPKEVFHEVSIPFFVGKNNEFFLENTTKEFLEGYFKDEDDCSFEIYYSNEQEKRKVIYQYRSRPAYDIAFRITNLVKIKDAYYNDDDNEYIIFNMLINFDSKYPVPWPDIDALISFCILNPEKNPEIKIIDIKSTGYEDKDQEFVNTCLQEFNK